jgi:hypothetical protein
LPHDGNNRAVARLRETKKSLPASLMTAGMISIEIDKNFISHSGAER